MEPTKRILLLMVSAVAYALAFPPYGWWPLAIVSVAVLAGMSYEARAGRGLMMGFGWGMLAWNG